MIRLCQIMLGLGIACYLGAVAFIQDDTGEILSDVGNALLLIAAVLLLLRLAGQRPSAPG